MKRVALVSARDAEAVDTDLPLLRAALEKHGIEHATFAWDDRSAPFASFDLAVIRSAWDYVPRRDEFVTWARALPCPVRNTADLVAWNTDKRYLAELERRNVAIVPTTWVGPESGARAAIALPNAEELVVKPTVSAGAQDTARYHRDSAGDEAARAHVERLVAAGRTVMVQPYIASVDRRGETGMLFFGGIFSHAISKGAILRGARREVAGLFAEENIAVRTPTAAELALAENVLGRLRDLSFGTPLYARVDVVEGEDGAPRLLELELTEPSVFLETDAGAADRFALAIKEAL